jgi:hypothetical protein
MSRRLEFKPLLLTTTMRNPERFREFLSVLYEYKGITLTNSLCTTICGELIRKGLYKPLRRSDQIVEKWDSGIHLSDLEVQRLLDDNPQNHGEAGFDYGWPSRFDTQFKLGKFFGFIYYKINEKIEFSKLGELYIARSEFEGQELYDNDEQQVFLNAFVNYHRMNPFQRVLNHNKPLILLLGLLRELEKNKELGSVGLYLHELPFLLIWKDANYVDLAEAIINFRKKHRFNVSPEVVYDEVEIYHGSWVPTRDKIETITREYPDDLLRKFRLTGLFSLRGNGSILSINSDLSSVVDYILEKHSELKTFANEREYYDYVSTVDAQLISQAKPRVLSDSNLDQQFLTKWITELTVQTIKDELRLLGRNRSSSHPILRLSPKPVRLEFLSSLLLKSRNPESIVIANYSRDDEGLPISHAPGNNPDIEIHSNTSLDLYEVTLTTGTTQAKAEFAPITRHLEDKIQEGKYVKENVQTMMIAPVIHRDFIAWIDFIKFHKGLRMSSKTIEQFIQD